VPAPVACLVVAELAGWRWRELGLLAEGGGSGCAGRRAAASESIGGESPRRRRWCHRPGLDRDIAQELRELEWLAEGAGGNLDAKLAVFAVVSEFGILRIV
jgi:hypothetical protein